MKSVDLLKNKGVMNFTLMFLLIIVYSFLQGILFEYVFKNIVGYNIISVLCSYIFSAVILLFFVKYFEKTTFEYFGFSKENNLEAIKVGTGLSIFSIVGVVAILLMSNNISLSLSKDLKIGIIIILAILVLMQPDFGTVMITVVMMWLLALTTGYSKKAIKYSGVAFVIGYFLMYVFSVQLKWVPLLANQGGIGLILPIITIVIPVSAKFIQQFSALLEQELQQEYVKVLYYRGMEESKIFQRHLLKNIFPTMVTIILLSFGSLMAGVVVVETIFYWPGIGKLLMDSISSRDYPVVQMIVVCISFLYIVLTQISDELQNRTDIRIKGGELS